MTSYKFRAECQPDINRLSEHLADTARPFYLESFPFEIDPTEIYPDREAILRTDLSIHQIRECIRKVPDGHVMLETLRLENEYTGERDFELS